MRDSFREHAVSVLNYALMPNHFHIQAIVGPRPLGRAMHQLETRYSIYFNKQYGRSGPLFQGRYKSFLCRDDAYLVQLPVYLSRNPIRAGLVRRPEDWEWSGHNELVSGRQRYLDPSRLEEVTGMTADDWRAEYLALMVKGLPIATASATLDELLDVSAQISGVSLHDLQEGMRGPCFSKARRHFAREALKRGFLQTDIADALGCAPSTVAFILAD
jgi:REP element-mobilizing transposase RayT